MAKRDFAFGKENLILIAVAVAVIAIGFMLMSGGGSQDPTGFNPEIFSSRRIVVAGCDSDRLRIDDFRNFKKQQK
mgnify:CR=1 FL=1